MKSIGRGWYTMTQVRVAGVNYWYIWSLVKKRHVWHPLPLIMNMAAAMVAARHGFGY